VRGQALEHVLHRLLHQLARLALAERRLAEACDALLVAQVLRLPLLGELALGDVARDGDDDPAVALAQRAAVQLAPASPAVLAGVGILDARALRTGGDDLVV